jgi:hypothetical protein
MIDPQKKELIDQINDIRIDMSLEPYPYEQLEQFSLAELETFLEKQMALKDTMIPAVKRAAKPDGKDRGKAFYYNPYYLAAIALIGVAYVSIFMFNPLYSSTDVVENTVGSIFQWTPSSTSTSTSVTSTSTTTQTLENNFTVSFAGRLIDGNPVFEMNNYGKAIDSFTVRVDGNAASVSNLDSLPILQGGTFSFAANASLCSGESHTVVVTAEDDSSQTTFDPQQCNI